MAQVKDPDTGLEFYELSHPWGMYTPIFPGYEEIKLERITYHAKHGVMTHRIVTIFHTSTHVNAPIHLLPEQAAVGDIPLETLLRHRRGAVDPQGQMGAGRAAGPGEGDAEDRSPTTSCSSTPAGIAATPTARSISATRRACPRRRPNGWWTRR